MIRSRKTYFIAFMLLVTALLFFNLGGWGLSETSEARYAEISREMVLTGDYLNPQYLGIYHYHKPPVTYYITTWGYFIFGINEFGARFFLQVAVLLQLLLVYKLTDLIFDNKKIAFGSTIAYFTVPILVIASRNLTTDIYLTTFIIAGLYHWLCYAKKQAGVWNLYLYYLFAGIAFETKGPVALLFFFTFIIAYRLIFKLKLKITLHHVLGFLLFAVVGLAWYIWVILEKPELINYFVFKQTVSRMADKSFHRDGPFWYYLPIIIGLLFPFIIGIIPSCRKIFRRSKEDKLIIVNIVVIIILFSAFSTKRIFYVLPVFWQVGVLVARVLHNSTDRILKSIRLVYLVLAGLYTTACIVLYFSKIADITISAAQLVTAVLLTIVAGVVYVMYFKVISLRSVYFSACCFMGIVIVSGSFFMGNNRNAINSFKPVVAFIDENSSDPAKKIMVFDYLISSIPFYTADDYYILNYLHDTTARDVQFQNDDSWKEHHVNIYLKSESERLEQMLSTGKNYVLVYKKFGLYPPFKFIEEKLPYQKDFGKWILYYN